MKTLFFMTTYITSLLMINDISNNNINSQKFTSTPNLQINRHEDTTSNPYTLKGYKLVWADEFNKDGSPDSSKWIYDIGMGDWGWGNNESQYYTNSKKNIAIEDGKLKIKAIKEAYEGGTFTSSRIKTQGKFDFKYGIIEVRAKVPEGLGTWPAAWMLGTDITTVGWPKCGEIDILEHIGRELNAVYGTLHYPDHAGANADGNKLLIQNATTEFHVFKVEWNENTIGMYVDDKLIHEVKNTPQIPFNHNFFIILNLAMGGNFGGPIDESIQEATYEVDYVRVYQLKK